MSRKRLTAWALVLATGMVARAGIAAPRAATAELRAIACCVRHCPDTPRPPMRAHRCCFVESSASDPASTAVAPSVERPATTAMMLPATIVRAPLAVSTFAAAPVTGRAGPPPFLDSLRLRC